MAKRMKKKPETTDALPEISGIAVHCSHDEIVPIARVIPNPRNPNKHPDSQLRLLAKVIAAQGWRAPITISRRSGFIVRGHGRYLSALLLGQPSVPVDWQDYENEAAEWADLIADNRIAELAEMDLTALSEELAALDTGDFDMELTGFDDAAFAELLSMDSGQVQNDPEGEWQGMPEFTQDDKSAFRTIKIHFKDQGSVDQFCNLIGQKISPKTRFLWFPEAEIERFADKRYEVDGE